MRFLLDTNVLIPLEPVSPANVEQGTKDGVRLVRLASENGHQLLLHPASLTDLSRDRDLVRRGLRQQLVQKYPRLSDPPPIASDLECLIGKAPEGSNDHIDNLILASLWGNAVDWLVTEDAGIQRKSRRARLADRVLSIVDAIGVMEGLANTPTPPPPAVVRTLAHGISDRDPILASFREDYGGFDAWLARCKREQRTTWLVPGDAEGIAGFCIVKEESECGLLSREYHGKFLKICSLKVSERYYGLKYGELLLKAIFDYAAENSFGSLYTTVFERQRRLIELLEDFGFEAQERETQQGERVMAKRLRFISEEAAGLDALARHVRYGPRYFELEPNRTFIIPIQPRFAQLLFPESAMQRDLFHGEHPFGSGMRKAYLCHARIQSLRPGDAILFYQSVSQQGIIGLGVVEQTSFSESAEEIARLVAKRTVYSMKDIRELARKKVLIVLFRQALVLTERIALEEARLGKVFAKPPQSIMGVRKEGVEWLRTRLNP